MRKIALSLPCLPHLLTLIPTQSGEDAYDVILAIQANCKYYNYEAFQAYLTAQKAVGEAFRNADRPTQQEGDRASPINNHFPNVTEVKIFENVDQYHETSPPPKEPPS